MLSSYCRGGGGGGGATTKNKNPLETPLRDLFCHIIINSSSSSSSKYSEIPRVSHDIRSYNSFLFKYRMTHYGVSSNLVENWVSSGTIARCTETRPLVAIVPTRHLVVTSGTRIRCVFLPGVSAKIFKMASNSQKSQKVHSNWPPIDCCNR